jgi:hypothetical protein
MRLRLDVLLLAALLTASPLATAEEPAAAGTQPAAGTAPAAADELLLERIEITGNRELPKVLYIVPWRKPDPGALLGKPVNTLLDEVLAPLDREEFIRQVDYYSDLYGDGASPPAAES